MENKNRPAFPLSDSGVISNSDGLTKRELIAAMAMQGLLSNPEYVMSSEVDTEVTTNETLNDAARHAVKAADELLKQLSQ